jgi:hypothetical protein
MTTAPLLSAILVTPDTFARLAKVVAALRAQSARERIELVIVAPSEEGLHMPRGDVEGFHGVRVVGVGEIDAVGVAQAAGTRAASGPIVVCVEEHSFPASGWAEALIRAHEGPWVAVGAGVANANPRSGASWTMLFLDFGQWVLPAPPGPAKLLPSHQTSYKRDVLLTYGETLGDLLETETTLQQDLTAKGHALYFEPTARTDHVNVSRVWDVAVVEFHNYKALAGNRVRDGHWSLARRAAYVVGSPLIPLVRGGRAVRELRRRGLARRLLPMILPTLAIGLIAGTAGEVLGFSIGAGDSPRRRVTFELDRLSHVNDRDRCGLLDGSIP